MLSPKRAAAGWSPGRRPTKCFKCQRRWFSSSSTRTQHPAQRSGTWEPPPPLPPIAQWKWNEWRKVFINFSILLNCCIRHQRLGRCHCQHTTGMSSLHWWIYSLAAAFYQSLSVAPRYGRNRVRRSMKTCWQDGSQLAAVRNISCTPAEGRRYSGCFESGGNWILS